MRVVEGKRFPSSGLRLFLNLVLVSHVAEYFLISSLNADNPYNATALSALRYIW